MHAHIIKPMQRRKGSSMRHAAWLKSFKPVAQDTKRDVMQTHGEKRPVIKTAPSMRERRQNLLNRVNLAPSPAITAEPVLQVYGARCRGWRGFFSLHTWIAVKPAGAKAYTVYEVTPEALMRRGCCVSIRKRVPDAYWYGAAPELLADKRGDNIGPLIERIRNAAQEYRYAGKYLMWPGPNSNTFIAHLARVVPELELELPCHAIGKDYLGLKAIGRPASGAGFQFSFFGLLGILVSRVEGIELNILGLSCGFNPFAACVKLPFVGHIRAARLSASEAPAAVPAGATEVAE
jgi:hypothetical protein